MAGTRGQLRLDAGDILQACLDAADPEKAVNRFLRVRGSFVEAFPDFRLSLEDFDRVFVVGAGKASAPMARAVEDMFGARIEGGVVCVKYGHALPLNKIDVLEAGHPLPDHAGEAAAARIINMLEPLGERDLVISCISGGGSALSPSVPKGITLEEKQSLTSRLLSVGADIHEINILRKHLSLTKGGRLMRSAYPAFVINLMLSDVVGDNPTTIASGPFVADASTFRQALDILDKYRLTGKVPDSIIRRLNAGARGEVPETPKPDDPIFQRLKNLIVGSNFLSLAAGEAKATELGYNAMLLSSAIEGDTAEAARFHTAIAREIRTSGKPLNPPACVLSGGETTVVLRGRGKGGRNQHFALSLVRSAAQISDSLFLSVGTDGTDGPTDAAGAVVDSLTLERAHALGMNPDRFLEDSDSYNFFLPLGDLIITGPTRTNVMDVRIVLIGG
jgi:hydroxypyruvate reductase